MIGGIEPLACDPTVLSAAVFENTSAPKGEEVMLGRELLRALSLYLKLESLLTFPEANVLYGHKKPY